jgi:hypothetical protein
MPAWRRMRLWILIGAASVAAGGWYFIHGQGRYERFALQGLSQVQKLFNEDKCELLLHEVDAGANLAKWVESCKGLRQDLGEWRSLASLETSTTSPETHPRTVIVRGYSTFINGRRIESYRLEAYWHVSKSEASLYYLYLEGGGKEYGLPTLLRLPPTQLDAKD